jgi:hypothetical protein
LGKEVRCQSCQKVFRTQVARPVAPVVEIDDDPQPAKSSVVEIDEPEDVEEGQKSKSPAARPKRTSGGQMVTLSIFLGVAIVVLGGGFGIYWIVQQLRPSAATEGLDWTLDDLMEHFKKKGIKFTIVPGGRNPMGPTSMFLMDPATPSPQEKAAQLYMTNTYDSPAWQGVILVQRWRAATAAQTEIAKHEGKGFIWGKFVFLGDPQFVAKVQSLLGK